MENKTRKSKFMSQKYLEKRIHKIYLIIALVFGIGMSVALPFFSEPDGQYHYVDSTNIAGLTNDITVYGETNQWYGDQYQYEVPAYQSGNFIDKYYKTKIKRIPIADLPRLQSLPHKYSYDYLSHLLPAAGVWLGYHIYPSMGVMITVGRLVSMFVCTMAMYFIIMRLRRGKLLFAAVSLSPTIMNSFSSLSYDATTYVLGALIVAMTINAVADKKLSWWLVARMAIVGFFSFFIMKTNLTLLIILFPLAIFGIWWSYYRGERFHIQKTSIRRLVWISGSLLALLAVLFVAIKVTAKYGGFVDVIYRLLINFTYNFNTGFDTNSIFVRPMFNFMPVWLTAVWFVLVFATALVDAKFVDSQVVSYGALLIFIANLAAVYMGFMKFPSQLGQNGIMGYVGGVQGRYFTPFFLLASLFAGNRRFKIKIDAYRAVTLMTIIIAVFSNFAWLFNNLFYVFFMHS